MQPRSPQPREWSTMCSNQDRDSFNASGSAKTSDHYMSPQQRHGSRVPAASVSDSTAGAAAAAMTSPPPPPPQLPPPPSQPPPPPPPVVHSATNTAAPPLGLLQRNARQAAQARAAGDVFVVRNGLPWLVCPVTAAALLQEHDGRGTCSALGGAGNASDGQAVSGRAAPDATTATATAARGFTTAATTTAATAGCSDSSPLQPKPTPLGQHPALLTSCPHTNPTPGPPTISTPGLQKPERDRSSVLLSHALTAVSGADWCRQRPAFEAAAGGGLAVQSRRHAEAVRQAARLAVELAGRGGVYDVVELAQRAAARGIVGAVLGPAQAPSPAAEWQRVECYTISVLRSGRRRRLSRDGSVVRSLEQGLMQAMDQQAAALLLQASEGTGNPQQQSSLHQPAEASLHQQSGARLHVQAGAPLHEQTGAQVQHQAGVQGERRQQDEPTALLARLLLRPELTRREAVCNANSCLMAGTETTASVVACSLLHLATRPQLQAHIRAALVRGLGAKGGRQPSAGSAAGATAAAPVSPAAPAAAPASGSTNGVSTAAATATTAAAVPAPAAGWTAGAPASAPTATAAPAPAATAAAATAAAATAAATAMAAAAGPGDGRSGAALLAAVMRETLRVHPPVMGLPRVVAAPQGLHLQVPAPPARRPPPWVPQRPSLQLQPPPPPPPAIAVATAAAAVTAAAAAAGTAATAIAGSAAAAANAVTAAAAAVAVCRGGARGTGPDPATAARRHWYSAWRLSASAASAGGHRRATGHRWLRLREGACCCRGAAPAPAAWLPLRGRPAVCSARLPGAAPGGLG